MSMDEDSENNPYFMKSPMTSEIISREDSGSIWELTEQRTEFGNLTTKLDLEKKIFIYIVCDVQPKNKILIS